MERIPLRNVGIVAHVDAGKTTLTEQMLYLAGELRAPGRVDDGTTQTDSLEVERNRGISVRAAAVSFPWQGVKINLIDTPGHVDFAGEVERALRVLDGAVLVLSAVEGVQAQTEQLFHALHSLRIPTVLFINKLDRVGADANRVLNEARDLLGAKLLPLQAVPPAQWDGKEPPPLWQEGDEAPAPEDAVAAASEADEALLEEYLSGQPISCIRLEQAAADAVHRAELNPVCFGAAIRGIGVGHVLDAVLRFLPPPIGTQNGPIAGVVYRIEHDHERGKTAHVRLYSGTLRNRDAVNLNGSETVEKVAQIRAITSGRRKDTGVLTAGDIAAVHGLNSARMGDILGDGALVPQGMRLATPLIRVQALPASAEELPRLMDALQELTDEDPTLDLQWLPDRRELSLAIMGTIQLEVLTSVIAQRFGLAVTFGKPAVIYRETLTNHGFGHESYTMPKPCWAILTLEMEPLPRGSGLVYSSTVAHERLLPRYQEHVRKTVPEALKQGLFGWEVTDLKVTLVDGEHHVYHTHPMDFFVATPMAIMDGLVNCGTTLLEPLLKLRVSAPEEACGRILQDIADMRGSFENPVIARSSFTVEAEVPVSTSLDYAVRLGALTGGRGVLSAGFAGYRPCPPELGASTPYRGVNPLDRSNYILKVRGAIGG